MILFLSLLPLAACGGASSSSGGNQSGTITISGSPPSTIGVGANWQYAATVSGGQAVTWSASAGMIDANTGLFIAPTSPAMVTITASAAGATSKSITATVQASDPLGTVNNVNKFSNPSCPTGGPGSVSGGTCFQLAISCPGVSDFSAFIKVNNPANAPVGTVLFGVGTGGSGLYDDPSANGYSDGGLAVQSILNAGYNTVQVSFGAPFDSGSTPRGWLTGPGGVRRLACRYATVADWVYHNPQTINPGVSVSNSAPMCATGNSGGSAVIAYAVYNYGLDPEFAMIEPTSGPVMTSIDRGCSPPGTSTSQGACTGSQQLDLAYSTGGSIGGDAAIIDEAYQSPGATKPTPCTDAINGSPGPDAQQLFQSDSILYLGLATVPLPKVTVKQLFGSTDTSNAVPQGTLWGTEILPNATQQCLPGVAHDIPSYSSGAMQIASDIAAACH